MKKILKIYFLLMVLVVYLPSAYAVPSFARQTGMDCAACHTSFPELTPFGRDVFYGNERPAATAMHEIVKGLTPSDLEAIAVYLEAQ